MSNRGTNDLHSLFSDIAEAMRKPVWRSNIWIVVSTIPPGTDTALHVIHDTNMAIRRGCATSKLKYSYEQETTYPFSTYTHVYVCMYVCMYVCILYTMFCTWLNYILTHFSKYICTYKHTEILTYIHTYIHIYIHTYIYTYSRTNIHTYISI